MASTTDLTTELAARVFTDELAPRIVELEPAGESEHILWTIHAMPSAARPSLPVGAVPAGWLAAASVLLRWNGSSWVQIGNSGYSYNIGTTDHWTPTFDFGTQFGNSWYASQSYGYQLTYGGWHSASALTGAAYLACGFCPAAPTGGLGSESNPPPPPNSNDFPPIPPPPLPKNFH